MTDMNIAIHDVGGKENFPFYLRLLKAFGIPYAVIGDGDAISPYYIDKNEITQQNRKFSMLWKVLQDLCLDIKPPQETDPFTILKQEALQAGFYTYNTSDPIAFEGISEVQAFLQGNAQPKKKADTIHEARLLAEIIPVPPLAKEILEQVVTRLRSLPEKRRKALLGDYNF